MKLSGTLVLIFSLLITQPAVAEQASYTHKDWVWSTKKHVNFAVTVNENEDLLGQFCNTQTGQCLYLLDVDLECDADGEYPALISTSAGTQATVLGCKGDGETRAFFLQPFDEIDRLVKTHNKIGLIMGVDDGRFKVARFSLRGSTRTINEMREISEKQFDNNTKDKPSESRSLPDGEYL